MPLAHAQGTVAAWLSELGAALGLNLALDENDALGLVRADGTQIVVEVEAGPDVVHIHAELLRLPADPQLRSGMLEEAMALNLHARRTEGATLGLDQRSDALILSVTRHVSELDAAGFAALLDGFSDTLDTLRDEFGDGRRSKIVRAREQEELIDPRLLA